MLPGWEGNKLVKEILGNTITPKAEPSNREGGRRALQGENDSSSYYKDCISTAVSG